MLGLENIKNMNIGFTTYDNITIENYQTELSLEKAGEIVNCYAEKMDLSTAKKQLFLPRDIIEAVYRDISEIEISVVTAMKGESRVVLPTYNEEGIELTPVEYNTIPTTIEGLKELVFSLIARDYSSKVSASYSIEQVEELRLKVYYCIDKIIQYSKSTKDGDWAFFSQQF